MKYLYSWLKEYYPNLPPVDELSDLLIKIGHDIEACVPVVYEGICVAEIKSVAKHPNADRLSVVEVTDGTHDYSVVCGAPNLEVGQKVAYAAVGATLPCGFTLKQAEIRGVQSNGMLCAEDELGLGKSHASLLPLPADATLGQPITAYVPEEAVFNLDITPNRGDVLSHFGLARDIQAAHAHTVLEPKFTTPQWHGQTSESVSIGDIHPDARAFSLGLVTSEMPGKTPLWLQARLNLLGQRSINLATDITNYLLLAYGQPLHAYDADKLPAKPVYSVRRAHNQEQFQGLTGKMFTLTPQALVVATNDKAIALAGVLGGETTKVGDKTTRVLFESAHFYAKPIRIMARGLQTLTDSAIHWERGVDFKLMEKVLHEAQAMYCELTNGQAYEPMLKVNPSHDETVSCDLDFAAMQQEIGTTIEPEKMKELLTGLGCTFNETTVQPPSWRPDLRIPEDYTEEVVRLIGLHELNKKPLSASVPQWRRSKWWRQEFLKDNLVSLGAMEISTYPFISNEELQLFPTTTQPIVLTQPAIEGKSIMRTSLIPGALSAIAANPETPQLILFEVAKVYNTKQETDMLVIATAGSNQAELDGWWQHLFERLRLPVSSWMTRVETVADEIKNYYKIRKPSVMVLTLPVSDLLQGKQFENPTVSVPDLDEISYASLSKFQASRRDVAFLVKKDHTVDEITQSIRALDPRIVAAELFDTYTDSKLGDDVYSLAFHIVYQAPDRTLTTDEIQDLHQKVENHIQEHYHGTIR